MAYKILLHQRDVNDATRVYIDILKDAIRERCGISTIEEVYKVSQVDKEDTLIIISLQALFKLLCHFRTNKFIFWFQGIVPEEVSMAHPGFYSMLKVPIFNLLERYILNNAEFILMVSKGMLTHYRNKYGYDKTNYLIMPCFNQSLDGECFTADKYKVPSFVYAGCILKWQCVEETIQLYAEIKNELPRASLTLLTPDRDEAHRLLKKHQVKADVKYVPMAQLAQELRKYKYGFLLRENHPVNRVATPTKMNSYLSAGIIPVYSEVMTDFGEVFSTLTTSVSCNMKSPQHAIRQICEIEKQPIDPAKVREEYEEIFASYYNRNHYVRSLRDNLPI